MFSNTKKGDRVRVVFEAEVGNPCDEDGDAILHMDEAGEVVYIANDSGDLISVEVIEPPVEVFKAGDLVRSKSYAEYEFLVFANGYYSLTHGIYYDRDAEYLERNFNSGNYELLARDFGRGQVAA